jgi:hypothetical protein
MARRDPGVNGAVVCTAALRFLFKVSLGATRHAPSTPRSALVDAYLTYRAL